MNRADFQDLAQRRIIDAEVLLKNDRHEAAYYLAGYSVECALKACIARRTKEFDFPDLKRVKASYTHNLEELLKVAELEDELVNERKSDAELDANWKAVKDWSEDKRYALSIPEQKARDLCSAISDPNHGVLQWLMKLW